MARGLSTVFVGDIDENLQDGKIFTLSVTETNPVPVSDLITIGVCALFT